MTRHRHPEEAPIDKDVAEGRVGVLHYRVRRVHDHRFSVFQIYQHNFDIDFRLDELAHRHHIQLLLNSYDAIYQALQHVQTFLINEYRDVTNAAHAQIQLTLMHQDLDPAINMPKMPLTDTKAVDDLMYQLEQVNQSHKTMSLDETLKVSVIINTVPPLEEQDQAAAPAPTAPASAAPPAATGTSAPPPPPPPASPPPPSSAAAAVNVTDEQGPIGGGGGVSGTEDDPAAAAAGEGSPSRKRRGRKLTLGPAFRHPDMTSRSRWMKVVPEFLEGPLVDCCFLTSLTAGYLYTKELEHNLGKRSLAAHPLTDAWKAVSELNSQTNVGRANKARKRLYEETLALCEKYGLNLERFRNIRDLEEVRGELDKLGVNVNVYDANSNYHLTFQNPLRPDPAKATISIIVSCNPVTNLRHCGTILRPSKFFSGEGKQMCPHCHQTFYKTYFRYHVCARKKRCDMCRRRRLQPGEYLDHDIVKNCCLADMRREKEAKRCGRCLRPCYDEECYKIHIKQCQRKEKCGDCGCIYRKNNRNYVHRCGDTWCPICKTYYSILDGPHLCQLQPPAEQETWNLVAYYDFETKIRRGEHIVNAVGVSAQSREDPTVFSIATFYENEMQSPHDGMREEEDCKSVPWDPRVNPKFVKVPKNIRPYAPCQFRNGPRSEQEAEEAAVLGEELESRIQSRQVRGADFLSTEAAEAAGEDSDEAEEGEEGEDREYGVADCMKVGDAGPSRPRWEGDQDFEEPSALTKFIDAYINENYYGYCFIAHNSSGFDALLLLRCLLARQLRVEPIFEGSRLLHLRIPRLRITFTDSYRFLNIPLAKFSERFPHAVKNPKGDFPHHFNRPHNYFYSGEVPEESYFCDKSTTEKKRDQVKAFRKGFIEEGKPWVFHDQIHSYLLQDVRMLRDGCQAFQKEIFDFQESMTKKADLPFHPFTQFFTASSLGHALFRYRKTGKVIIVSLHVLQIIFCLLNKVFFSKQVLCHGEGHPVPGV